MTNVSYDIMYKNRIAKNVATYDEAKDIVKALGNGWTYKVRYTEFDPSETPKYIMTCKAHAEKICAKLGAKRVSLA